MPGTPVHKVPRTRFRPPGFDDPAGPDLLFRYPKYCFQCRRTADLPGILCRGRRLYRCRRGDVSPPRSRNSTIRMSIMWLGRGKRIVSKTNSFGYGTDTNPISIPELFSLISSSATSMKAGTRQRRMSLLSRPQDCDHQYRCLQSAGLYPGCAERHFLLAQYRLQPA